MGTLGWPDRTLGGLADGTLHPHAVAASGLILVFGGLAYLMLFANCATFAACVRTYVAFLLTLAAAHSERCVAHDFARTVLGAALA